jgi:hypothetical protein
MVCAIYVTTIIILTKYVQSQLLILISNQQITTTQTPSTNNKCYLSQQIIFILKVQLFLFLSSSAFFSLFFLGVKFKFGTILQFIHWQINYIIILIFIFIYYEVLLMYVEVNLVNFFASFFHFRECFAIQQQQEEKEVSKYLHNTI